MRYLGILLFFFGLSCQAETFSFQDNPTPAPCKEQLSKETCMKIGQMLIVGFGGLSQDEQGKINWQDINSLYFTTYSNIARAIKEYHIGGVILFTRPFRNAKTGKFIRDRNIRNPQQTAQLTTDLQEYSKQSFIAADLPPVPLLISIDQEGGMIDRLPKELGFTQRNLLPQALGANQEKYADKALIETKAYATEMAKTLTQLHFNLNFAPCLDLNVEPLNPILGGRGRCFSANPRIVSDQAWQFVQSFHENTILASLKHFPGHGSSSEDSHEGIVNVTESYIKDKELAPYKALIKKGYADIIMTAHVINGNIDNTQCKAGKKNDPNTWCPGTLSHKTITELLRKELGFQGVVISDDMTMGAIAKEYDLETALEKALLAGVDMFIFANNVGDDTERAINTIAKLVKSGKISEEHIDVAYQRILRLKKKLGEPL